jgi:hypothetical protein
MSGPLHEILRPSFKFAYYLLMVLQLYASLIESMLGRTGDTRSLRGAHQPLLLYSRLQGMEAAEYVDVQILDAIEKLDGSIWSSLILQMAGELFDRPMWIDKAALGFKQLIAQQQPSGEFLLPDANVHPETRWYDELVTLHATASYAVRVPGAAIQSAVERSARYHLNEIQPDHATTEPWGLLAFIQYAPSLADQMLHAMSMQYPQGITGIPLLLLADVQYGLRRLMDENGNLKHD